MSEYPNTSPEMKTDGLSPKALLAFLFPLIAALVATGTQWLVTGEFSSKELITALSGLGASGLALLGAYIGAPGHMVPVGSPIIASDSRLPSEALTKIQAHGDAATPITPADEGHEAGYIDLRTLSLLLIIAGVIVFLFASFWGGLVLVALALGILVATMPRGPRIR